MPTVASAGTRNSVNATISPVALVTPDGNTIIEPLLKVKRDSRPSSRIFVRQRRRQRPNGGRLRLEQHRAVFGDDPIEECRVLERVEQIAELAPGDHDQAETGPSRAQERVDDRRIDLPLVRERAVVVGGNRRKSHGATIIRGHAISGCAVLSGVPR